MSKITVCIDPGHGGKDPGAVKGKRYEKDDALRLALRVGKVLKANGLKVIYTRTTDRYDSPSEKAQIANKNKADYFISIHRNSAGNGAANGAEVLVYATGGTRVEIAKSIQKLFAKHGFADRGVKVNPKLTVLKNTTMPAVLCEVGFISNAMDNKLFDTKLNKYADCIAKGLMDAIGLQFKAHASAYKPKANITPKSSKKDIKWLQEKLNKAVPSCNLTTDGIFGMQTRITVLQFAVSKGWKSYDKATGYNVGVGTINVLSKL